MTPITASTVGDLSTLLPPFERHLRAENLAPRTIETYGEAARQFLAFLRDAGMPTDAGRITREHVESFIEHLVATRSASTANNRFRSLQSLFKFLVDIGEISDNPMGRMRPPKVPDAPVAVISDADLGKLLKTTDGKTFEDRRDNAVIRLFIDGGVRLSELANIRLEDLELDNFTVYVQGKGRRARGVSLGNKTARALDYYLRLRARQPGADSPWLWLGRRGRMTPSGIRQMIERRATQAGLGHIHPHMFRHAYAHRWLADGGSETGLMSQAGWKSRTMLSRYGASAAAERARDEHRRLALGDRL